jgi:hypothetical protein
VNRYSGHPAPIWAVAAPATRLNARIIMVNHKPNLENLFDVMCHPDDIYLFGLKHFWEYYFAYIWEKTRFLGGKQSKYSTNLFISNNPYI